MIQAVVSVLTFLFLFEMTAEFWVCGHHARPPGVSRHLCPNQITNRKTDQQWRLFYSFIRHLRNKLMLEKKKNQLISSKSTNKKHHKNQDTFSPIIIGFSHPQHLKHTTRVLHLYILAWNHTKTHKHSNAIAMYQHKGRRLC